MASREESHPTAPLAAPPREPTRLTIALLPAPLAHCNTAFPGLYEVAQAATIGML